MKIMLDKIDKKVFEEEITLIDRYSQYLSKTIDDFRNFFKKNKTKTNVTPKEIFEDTLKIIGKSLENKNIKIIKKYNSDKKFWTYKNELIQVILNIIKNAEDAILEKDIKNPYIILGAENTKDSIIMTVEDNAGGIPSEVADKIFDPYFSTKFQKDGTGLGLYMSKIIIENHCGGSLKVQNGKDGAIFFIELILDKK